MTLERPAPAMTGRPQARRILQQSIVWDNHTCLPFTLADEDLSPLIDANQAGYTYISINIGAAEMPLEEIVRAAAHFKNWILRRAEHFVFVGTTADVRRAKSENKTAIGFDIEGAYALQGQISLVPFFFDLGVRWMSMAFNKHNWAAAGCHDAEDHGLTALGRELTREMDRVGMVKCCSHTGYRTAMDVLSESAKPVIFSHSNARALHDHPRNIPDELIKACAATDGVVGVNGLSIFLTSDGGDLVEAMKRHIDHIVQLVGARHVGLGVDFVYSPSELETALAAAPDIWPPGYGYGPGISYVLPDQIGPLCEALLALGYSETDLGAILGGNFLRVADAVWPAKGDNS